MPRPVQTWSPRPSLNRLHLLLLLLFLLGPMSPALGQGDTGRRESEQLVGRVREMEAGIEESTFSQAVSQAAQRMSSGDGGDSTIILTTVASADTLFLLNWLRTVTALREAHRVLFVAEDTPAFDFLRHRWPNRTVLGPTPDWRSPLLGLPSAAVAGVVQSRAGRAQLCMLALLQNNNLTVLYSEVHGVWLKDPLQFLLSPHALAFDALIVNDAASLLSPSPSSVLRSVEALQGSSIANMPLLLRSSFLLLRPSSATQALLLHWLTAPPGNSSAALSPTNASACEQGLLSAQLQELLTKQGGQSQSQSLGEAQLPGAKAGILRVGVLPATLFPSPCAVFGDVGGPEEQACCVEHEALEEGRKHEAIDPLVVYPADSLGREAQMSLLLGMGQWDPAEPAWEDSTNVASEPTDETQLREFLESYTAFPGEGSSHNQEMECGVWAEQYAELHRRMRAGEVPGRFITWSWPSGGIGDQLMGITNLFLAALLSGRALILHEGNLEAMFEPNMVDWRLRDDVPMNVTGDGTVQLLHMRCRGQPDEWGNQATFPTDMQARFTEDGARSAINLIVSTNGGVVARVFGSNTTSEMALRSLGLNANNTYACVLRFLLRPSKEVMNQAAAAMAGRPQLDLCVHVRSRDGLSKYSTTEQEETFAVIVREQLLCAKALSERLFQTRQARWLVVADQPVIKKWILEWSRNFSSFLVMETKIEPRHFPLSAARVVADPWITGNAAEWLLFSACPLHVFPPSGFSKIAWAYNPRRSMPYVVPMNVDRPQLIVRRDYWNCSDPQASPLTALLSGSGF